MGSPADGPDENHTDGRDPLVAFTGDQASAARLRANLLSVAQAHSGTGVESTIHEVLAGRRPVRDLADDPDLSEVIEAGMDDYRSYLASLTPQERADMVAAAKQEGGDEPARSGS